jgi:hypothetical protein
MGWSHDQSSEVKIHRPISMVAGGINLPFSNLGQIAHI